jgi:phage repressor protein C with HTH and peptisase S24 domain
MSVSRWERGLLAPAAATYIRLGRLAGGSDAWFFWGQAGLEAADVTRNMPGATAQTRLPTRQILERAHAAGTTQRKTGGVPKVVPLPLLSVTLGTHGRPGVKKLSLDRVPATKMITAPTEWCPNPHYTSLIRVRGNSMEPLIRDGDILAVDSFQSDRAELEGKVVVATHEQNGMCVSRLRHYETLDVLESEDRLSAPIVLGKNSGWRIVGRVLWWISAAP